MGQERGVNKEIASLDNIIKDVESLVQRRGLYLFRKEGVLKRLKDWLPIGSEEVELVQYFETTHLRSNSIDLIIGSRYSARPLVDIACKKTSIHSPEKVNDKSEYEILARKYRTMKDFSYDDFRIELPYGAKVKSDLIIYDWGSRKPLTYYQRFGLVNGDREVVRLIDTISLIANEIKRQEQYNINHVR